MISLNHNYYHAWDILGLYRQLFGHAGIPWGKPIETGSGKDYDERYVGERGGKSIGVWDGETLTGYGQRVSDLKGQPFMMPLKIEDYTFPIEPLVSVSGNKTVIETKVTGLSAPVNEVVAMENYRITVKGVYINEDNDDYPYRDVSRLSYLLERRRSLPVVNKLLAIFDINDIIVTSIKCDAVEGEQSMQWYIIEAIADKPVELVLNNA